MGNTRFNSNHISHCFYRVSFSSPFVKRMGDGIETNDRKVFFCPIFFFVTKLMSICWVALNKLVPSIKFFFVPFTTLSFSWLDLHMT